ncbi:MAG TPA: HEAT repeat domain-containing protein [Phycisphaerae bacterium]|nr:HEAT repeat domain-containing protein [Phycisphaerae bacterium]
MSFLTIFRANNTGQFQAVAVTAVIVLTFICASTKAAGEKPLPQPQIDASTLSHSARFGGDRTVELLGDILLKSEDVYERSQAAMNLGQTNNMNAVKFLVKGSGDKEPQVRISVITAAAALAQQTPDYMRPNSEEYQTTVDIIRKGFADSSESVRVAAISSAAAANVLENKIIKAAAEDDQLPAMQAIIALNRQHRGIKNADSILKHLSSDNLCLQIVAAENLIYADSDNSAESSQHDTTQLIATLKKLSQSGNDALAATAIVSLTALNSAAAKPFIEKAAKSNSPLMRRAAVKSFAIYHELKAVAKNAEKPATEHGSIPTSTDIRLYDRISPYLDDASPLVQLAAVNAAEVARKNGVLLNQTQKLIDIAFNAPDTQLHNAAMTAAAVADGEIFTKIIAAAYGKMMPEYLASKNPAGSILERNLSGVCRMLGRMKSAAVFGQMLQDIEKLPIDSIIIGDIADSLANTGDKAADEVLERMLKKCHATGAKYLIAIASMAEPPAFSEDVTAKIINALASLDDKQATDEIIKISVMNIMGMKLTTVSAASADALAKLYDDTNRTAIDKLLIEMIADKSYGNIAMLNAIIAAGRLKLPDAVKNLKIVLNDERPSKIAIWAAAWAIGQISGQYPPQPQPVQNQGDWLIKSTK